MLVLCLVELEEMKSKSSLSEMEKDVRFVMRIGK